MNEQLTPADVLERAADRIDANGHWQHGVFGTSAGECPVIAIGNVVGAANRGTTEAVRLLADSLGVSLLMPGHAFTTFDPIYRWNDAPERTKEDVTSAMRAAAVVWRAQNQCNPVPAGAQKSEIVAKNDIYPTSGSPLPEPITA